MNNQLIPSQKNCFFTRIKLFFCKLFGRKKEMIESDYRKKTTENNFLGSNESLKVEVDNSEIYQKLGKEKFIKQLENDDTILEKLSLERLKILEKYYEKKVQEKEEILRKLENDIS